MRHLQGVGFPLLVSSANSHANYGLRRRTKCSGTQPCERCRRLTLNCGYRAAYARGRPPTPPRLCLSPRPVPSQDDGTTAQVASLDVPPAQEHSHLSLPEDSSSSLPSRGSPELAGGVAHEGPYLGPASGVAFLNRTWQRLNHDRGKGFLQESLEKASRASNIFRFGNKTFPDYKDEMLVLPPWQDAVAMVAKYFDLVTPTYRFLHRDTVDHWLAEMYRQDENSHERVSRLPPASAAIVLLIFADTTLFHTDVEDIREHAKEEAYDTW